MCECRGEEGTKKQQIKAGTGEPRRGVPSTKDGGRGIEEWKAKVEGGGVDQSGKHRENRVAGWWRTFCIEGVPTIFEISVRQVQVCVVVLAKRRGWRIEINNSDIGAEL